jgi:hypothetical protein
MSTKTYDPACYQLALEFLTDSPLVYTKHAEPLAQAIQQAIEDYLEQAEELAQAGAEPV